MPTTSGRSRELLDLPIRLDCAIRNQARRVHDAIRTAIIDGFLTPGLKLPSSRELAAQLGMGRNTIVAAYEHLLADGLVDARHGAGTYVASLLPTRPQPPGPQGFEFEPVPVRPFALGHTHADAIMLRRLATHVRRRITMASTCDLGYGDPRGSQHLRSRIAEHLAATRGVRCDPSCIVVVSGAQHAFQLCIDALLSPGDAVWMEDPGYQTTLNTVHLAGLVPVPVPVDSEGIIVDAGRRAAFDAKAVWVTPSHQFPTGVAMSMERRVALLDWAREAGAWVIEDDYNSEFRFAGAPLTALAGLSDERVIYIGTFSKSLFPGLRLAFLVAPPQTLGRIAATRAAHDRFPPVLMQDAVGDLMAEGVFASHIRRMRTRYRGARDAVTSTLNAAAQGLLQVDLPRRGLHFVAFLPEGTSKEVAIRIRDTADVTAMILSDMYVGSVEREGFVIGFSGHAINDLVAAAERLGHSVRHHLSQSAADTA